MLDSGAFGIRETAAAHDGLQLRKHFLPSHHETRAEINTQFYSNSPGDVRQLHAQIRKSRKGSENLGFRPVFILHTFNITDDT